MRKSKRPSERPHNKKRPSAQIKPKHRKRPRNKPLTSVKASAKSKGRKKTSNSLLTRFPETRGRKGVRASFVTGRAYNFETILSQHREDLDWDKLRGAKTHEDLEDAFKGFHPTYLDREFRPRFDQILKVVQDKRFPKGRRDRQIQFFAESLAGLDAGLSPRRSRDICYRERTKPRHEILRWEFYIECSCGYKGHSFQQACPRCDPRERPGNPFTPFNLFGTPSY